jgi:hypothetical protein
MQRPGPLQELPLERFLPSCPSKSVRNHKRPLSPGSPNPYSPTKRRILNSEGIFAPEKTFKTPMSLGKASPARFGDVLASSASPAKILDFGLPKSYGGEPRKSSLRIPTQTQIPSLSSRKTLTSSPELKCRRVSTQQTNVVPIIIPRELPPPPDPQSIHYPGFVVFRDTHLTIYPADFNPERVSDVDMIMDPLKENLPPHRKTLRKTLKFEATPVEKSKSATGTPNEVISPMRMRLRRMMEEDDDLEEGGQNGDE